MTSDRFDQIVEFAGLEDAIDRQVKFFSLGMQMRLGFSIAAFLKPDILLVDEALFLYSFSVLLSTASPTSRNAWNSQRKARLSGRNISSSIP